MNKEQNNQTQNRFKSRIFWIGVIADTLLLLQITGSLKKLGLDFGVVQDVSIIASTLIFNIIGLANNPTNKSGF